MNSSDGIIKNAVKQIKDLGVETVKEFGKAAGKITKGMGVNELLGDIKSMSDEELQKRKMEEEKKKREEEQKLKALIKGNNLEEDMKKLREERERTEQEKEKQEMEQKKREEEERQRQEMENSELPSSPNKQKKKRGGAFLPNDKKTQTAEYSKKPD